jgi:hypothetical protein
MITLKRDFVKLIYVQEFGEMGEGRWHPVYDHTRVIRKVTFGGLLTKQAMRKTNSLYAKNTYILELLLNSHRQN